MTLRIKFTSKLVRCAREQDCMGIPHSKCNNGIRNSTWKNSIGHCECLKGRIRYIKPLEDQMRRHLLRYFVISIFETNFT